MIYSTKKSWANSINDFQKNSGKYDSVKLPVCQFISGQLKSPPNSRVYQEIFALTDKYNGLNHSKLTQETEVDSKMNQELYYSVYRCGSAPIQLHRVSQL